MKTHVRFTGVEASIRSLERLRWWSRAKIKAGLEKAAQVVLLKALYYVPVDTGALRDSGRVVPSQSKSGDHAVQVRFGNNRDVYYAAIVHENMEAFHTAPTSAKYLERATREMRDRITRIIGRSVGTSSRITPAGEGD